MDSLLIGSAQSWLDIAAATLGPLIAFMVGFEDACHRHLAYGPAETTAPLRRTTQVSASHRGEPGTCYVTRRSPCE